MTHWHCIECDLDFSLEENRPNPTCPRCHNDNVFPDLPPASSGTPMPKCKPPKAETIANDRVFPAMIVMSGCDLNPEVRQKLKEVFSDNMGLSLRDYFAGQALVGIMTNGHLTQVEVTHTAYRYADAMLEERKKEGKQA